jgi:hypothetical protein
VPYEPLKNYLRPARRRSGLFQNEIAFLVGIADGTRVSRHEAFGQVPSAATVFAYEIIFQTRARVLFSGTYDEVQRTIINRSKRLIESLAAKSDDPRTSDKLKFLQAIVEGQADEKSST